MLVGSWPRTSTTFIAQELVGLEREGLRLWVASLKHGEPTRHALHDELTAEVHYLPFLPVNDPARFLRALRKMRGTPGYKRARDLFRAEAPWGRYGRRLRLFAQAVVLAAEMPPECRLIYVHFIHKPGTVARYVAAMTGLPLAASAHARDIWTTPDLEKRDKLASMRWVTTCNGPAVDDLQRHTDDPDKIKLIYHGLSLRRFPEDAPARPPRDGSDPADPIRLLSVGRAVEKKGFDVLIDVLARLPSDLHWRFDHIGGGKLLPELKARAEKLGLNDRLRWHGPQTQATVIEYYRSSDLFVFPAREADDGDKDGLPNVLMEAQSQALPCLSTQFTAIPELIRSGETGMLVQPGDRDGLLTALQELIRSPQLRSRLGTAGFERVRSAFQAEEGIHQIADLLRAELQ
ncbi:glycosyltransferase family 4 protein [Sphingomonas sp. GCM10030256]|uniref:glycosyltransferase family 4 protein n=1 Tax=Sphingomonas sp. GCM10030256 TaxID=3273427 RepID=UPI0036079D0A